MRASTFSSGGVIGYPRPLILERRGCMYVIPKAEVMRLGAEIWAAWNAKERTDG